jgi:hypothetical protein
MSPRLGTYFSFLVPGVVLASSGAEGLMWPKRFSGVLDWTLVGPGPAVAGLSPFGPEGSTAWREFAGGC